MIFLYIVLGMFIAVVMALTIVITYLLFNELKKQCQERKHLKL